jgi:hypothetical protein
MGALEIAILVGILAAVVWVLLTVANRARAFVESRPCLRCGNRVPIGELDCPHCGFDFRTIGAKTD